MGELKTSRFAGGELAPNLHGSSDLPRYGVSLRTGRNVLITRSGAALARPGTKLVKKARQQGTTAGQVRMIPFVYSEDQSYVLEFGDHYVRVYQDGAAVAAPAANPYGAGYTYDRDQWCTSNGGKKYRSLQNGNLNHDPASSPTWWAEADCYEIWSEWTAAELDALGHSQASDILTLTSQVRSCELQRFGHQDWRFKSITFDPTAAYFYGSYPRCFAYDNTHLVPPTDAAHPERELEWLVTSVVRDNVGRIFETRPEKITLMQRWGYPWWNANTQYHVGDRVSMPGNYSGAHYSASYDNIGHDPTVFPADWNAEVFNGHWETEQLPAKLALYPDQQLSLTWGVAIPPNPTYTVLYWRIYRGAGGVYGWLADTKLMEWRDDGREPDCSVSPPMGMNPFTTYNADGTVKAIESPAALEFFEQRRIFANTASRPATLMCSRAGSFVNFDRYFPGRIDDALELEVASKRFEEIRALVGLERLWALTNASVWEVGGAGNGDPLSKESIQITRRANRGASWLDPLVLDDGFLFEVARGYGVRFMRVAEGKPTAIDLGVFAQHLFESSPGTGYRILAWSVTENPTPCILAVRSDGKLLALTYVPELEIVAWTRGDTEGLFEDVCVVPEGQEDAVYFLARRYPTDGPATGVVYLERMTRPRFDDVREAVSSDCALTYDGRNTNPATLLGLVQHAGGGWAAGATIDVLQPLSLPIGAGSVGEYLVFLHNTATPVRLEIQAVAGTTITCRAIDAIPLSLQDASTATWGVTATTITGLAHLNGLAVVVNVDGLTEANFVWNGFLNLATPRALVAHIGLGYAVEVETLDAAISGGRAKQKTVPKVFFDVLHAGGLEAAESIEGGAWSPAPAVQLTNRQAKQELVEVQIANGFNRSGRAALRLNKPLPLLVHSVIREVDVAG